jgi:regulator of protease activity HflC (stomatin/prohibitin superfamily)
MQVLQTGGVVQAIAIVLLLTAVVVTYKSIVTVNPYEKRAYTRLGKYKGVLDPGVNVVLPFVTTTYAFDMRTQTLDVPPVEAVTQDDAPVTADAVVYVEVIDVESVFLEVDDYREAVTELAESILRKMLTGRELDGVLKKREEIGTEMKGELNRRTHEWGIRVESVEIREVNTSQEIHNAMAEAVAERQRDVSAN